MLDSRTSRLIAHVNRFEITDERRAQALEATAGFLKNVDVRAVEQLRQKFELPPEAFSFVMELYITQLGEPRMGRGVLPVSSLPSSGFPDSPKRDNPNVLPTQMITLKVPTRQPLRPERVFISSACTAGGAADWIIEDIRVDGKTQFQQKGPIPGDMFATTAIDGFVHFEECREYIEIDVTYIGTNKDGAPFFASVVGDADPPTTPAV